MIPALYSTMFDMNITDENRNDSDNRTRIIKLHVTLASCHHLLFNTLTSVVLHIRRHETTVRWYLIILS